MIEISSASQNSDRVKVMTVHSQHKQLEDAGDAVGSCVSVMQTTCSNSGT